MGCKLLPFRDYDEHEVINLFKYAGTIPADQGTIVSRSSADILLECFFTA